MNIGKAVFCAISAIVCATAAIIYIDECVEALQPRAEVWGDATEKETEVQENTDVQNRGTGT